MTDHLDLSALYSSDGRPLRTMSGRRKSVRLFMKLCDSQLVPTVQMTNCLQMVGYGKDSKNCPELQDKVPQVGEHFMSE